GVIEWGGRGREGSRWLRFGSSPWRNFAGTTLADSGRALRPRRGWLPSVTPGLVLFCAAARTLPGSTFMKKAAMPQYSFCFHFVNGWSWHWAHWSWMPRNALAVTSVILSTEELARKSVTAPFLSCSPDAVTSS